MGFYDLSQVSAQVGFTGEARDRFKEYAKANFGQVDPETQKYRGQCKDLGFRIVFSSGLSRQQTLAVLRHPETQRILASC